MKAAEVDIDDLLKRESEQVEWKEGVGHPDDVALTLCAFANDFNNFGGGYVICGIEESEDEHGFKRAVRVGLSARRIKEIEGQVLGALRDRAEPALVPEVFEVPGPTAETRILVFFIRASNRVHSFRHEKKGTLCPIRMSAQTVQARNGLYLDLLTRKGVLPPWDRRAAANASIDEIDRVALRDGLQRMGLWDEERPLESWLDPNVPLSALAPPLVVMDGGEKRPAHFALLLFGRAPTLRCPGAWTQLSIYPGTERATDSARQYEITGPLPQQAERVLAVLKDQSPIVIDKRVTQQNLEKYPERALREATVNAIVHRDYTSDQPTRITVFADRIEFTSPGALPPGVDRVAFAEGRAHALWRNQSLAWVFRRLGLAQAEGQGLRTIRSMLAAAGSPAPTFLAEEAQVHCIVPAHPRDQALAGFDQVRRLLDANKSGEAWTLALALWNQDPHHPTTQELLVEAAIRSSRLPEVIRLLEDTGVVLGALSQEGRVSLIEAELLEAQPDEPLSPLVEAFLNDPPELTAAQMRRLIFALIPARGFEALLKLVERYSELTPQAKRDLTMLKPAADAALSEARRLADQEADSNLPPILRARVRDRLDAFLPTAQALNRFAENAAFWSKSGRQKRALDDDYEALTALANRRIQPTS